MKRPSSKPAIPPTGTETADSIERIRSALETREVPIDSALCDESHFDRIRCKRCGMCFHMMAHIVYRGAEAELCLRNPEAVGILSSLLLEPSP